MSYAYTKSELESRAATFARDVFDYLNQTGRSEKGRSYFGVLAANNPALVARLEQGKLPGLAVMLGVWEYMENHPPEVKEGGCSVKETPSSQEAAE
jgi:hypothetical protein